MPTLVYLYLLLAGFSTLVSSKRTPSPTSPAVYNNCSGDYPLPLPSGAASTSHFKLQIAVNPHKSGAGWEEWLIFVQGMLPDGSGITYGYRWSRGDPGSTDLSDTTFSASLYFPNGTFHHSLVHDAFEYGRDAGGGFTCSIGNNHLTWDAVQESWQISVNADGFIASTHIEV